VGRKTKSKSIEQKEGRNSNSNMLRMFFRRLAYKVENCPRVILEIIRKHQLDIALDEFILWLENTKTDYRNYIKISSIRSLFLGQDFVQEHTKLMRVLLGEFIRNEALPCYLTSKKAMRGVMIHNLASLRLVMQELFNKEPRLNE
jgi:hypothetical protein